MTDHEWAKAIIMHLTGRPEEPTPMLLKMVNDIAKEGAMSVSPDGMSSINLGNLLK